MHRLLTTLVFLLAGTFANTASAQETPGFFSDYGALDTFLNTATEQRDYSALLNRLGGGDEYTVEQMNGLKVQLDGIFPNDFDQKLVFGQTDLGGGLSKEGRAYFSDETIGYLWFYLLLHDRGDELVVVEFSFNSSAGPILAKF